MFAEGDRDFALVTLHLGIGSTTARLQCGGVFQDSIIRRRLLSGLHMTAWWVAKGGLGPRIRAQMPRVPHGKYTNGLVWRRLGSVRLDPPDLCLFDATGPGQYDSIFTPSCLQYQTLT